MSRIPNAFAKARAAKISSSMLMAFWHGAISPNQAKPKSRISAKSLFWLASCSETSSAASLSFSLLARMYSAFLERKLGSECGERRCFLYTVASCTKFAIWIYDAAEYLPVVVFHVRTYLRSTFWGHCCTHGCAHLRPYFWSPACSH